MANNLFNKYVSEQSPLSWDFAMEIDDVLNIQRDIPMSAPCYFDAYKDMFKFLLGNGQ